jgi:hypothetical protein
VKDILKKIDEVTVSGVKKVCEKIFKPSLTNLAMISNISAKEKGKIRKELSKL